MAAAALVFSLATATELLETTRADGAAGPPATITARCRARIPQLMAEQHVPGLAVAVALVDADQPLWVEGFGHIDRRGSARVTADTIFSVQSMSKLFTATAVMQAVAAGRLDLDAPITTYLPKFTVHSAFEKHPERKITLRMLLSHTAGFAQEAPVGNNNDLDPGSFGARPERLHGRSRRFGLDRTLVVEDGHPPIRRRRHRVDGARPATRNVASHRVKHELRLTTSLVNT